MLSAIAETGRYDGTKSLLNLLYKHLDRTAAHLYSPVELKFSIDFELKYPKQVLDRGAVVAHVLTRQWDRNDTDLLWGEGVFESLKYGCAILKQWVQSEGPNLSPNYYAKLVMPWQFGVYNESETDLKKQPAVCETQTMTLPEIWRRIWHLPNAKKMYQRISTHAMRGAALSDPQSYFHQVLSTSQLNTGVQGMTRPLPGGIVQLNNDPNYAIMGPQIAADVVNVHEIWVQDDDDYTTIIMIEPDVIICPLYKKANLLVKGSKLQPYSIIQPNRVTNWFWGRSELIDLIEPQALLSTTLDDQKRLIGLQVDKIMAFTGDNGIDDERYGQLRGAGYINLVQGSEVKDMTPNLPPEIVPYIKFLIEQINILGGFPPLMQGQGEPGVRAQSHASTLLKTGSPTLRDRSLIVERQIAIAADLTLAVREAKDPTKYWTDGDTTETIANSSFLLTDLPDDWRVTVDSHSSSPIFQDENTQLVMAAHKLQIVDGEYVIDNTQLPNKAAAKTSLKERQKRAAEEKQLLLQQHPEIGEKLVLKQLTGGKR
jgi:hypothetical protein